MNCRIFSITFNSGHFGGNGSKVYTYDIPLTVTAFEAGLRRL